MHQDDTWRDTDLARSYDAVVIGSGAGGAPLALRLGQRGLRVLVVEQGDFLKVERGGADTPPGKFITKVMGSRDAPLSVVGGRTKFYGAALYRMRESDFREVAHEAGTSPAWPISYAELEPYYAQAERLYRVHGAPDGDPSEPPRANPYPFPPLPHGPVVADVVRRLEKTGTRTAAIPNGLDYGPGGKCVLCASCDAHYCTLDANGVCQRSYPVPHQVASLILRSSVSRSGLRQTSPTGDQLRIWRDHRVGLAARASV
jgi:choline dehydrogenase-like flavoprotein